jgi:glucose-1-phosphatase
MKLLQNVNFLLFDLGNVFIKIDYAFTFNELRKILGEEKFSLTQGLYPSSFHLDYEKGKISDKDFRFAINQHFGTDWEDEIVDEIWNSLLIEIMEETLALITRLRSHYQLGVLSNTNSIHINAMNKMLVEKMGKKELLHYFDHVFLSHELGLRKPDVEIYHEVVKRVGLPANEILFFDDLPANLKGAEEAGLRTHLIKEPKELISFFENVHI